MMTDNTPIRVVPSFSSLIPPIFVTKRRRILPLFLLFIVIFRAMELIMYEYYSLEYGTVDNDVIKKIYFSNDMFRNLNEAASEMEVQNFQRKQKQQQQQQQKRHQQQQELNTSGKKEAMTTRHSLAAKNPSPKKYDDANKNPPEEEEEEEKKNNVELPHPTFNSSCIPTALASYPGSGSTITRLLIEMATGVYTGSIYRDGSLYNGKPYPFHGELTTDNVVAVKTHGPFHSQWTFTDKAERAIIMVRNPYSAIPSYYNWWWGSQHDVSTMHQIQAPKEDWEAWRRLNVPIQLKEWIDHFTYWMDSKYYPKDALFIGKFEDLIDKVKGPKTLQVIANFLDFPSSLQRMEVIWQKSMNISSGIHRPKSYRAQYLPDQATIIHNQLQKLHVKYGTNNTFLAGILDEYMNSISKYTVAENSSSMLPRQR